MLEPGGGPREDENQGEGYGGGAGAYYKRGNPGVILLEVESG